MTKAETETQIATLKEIVVEHKEILKTLDRDRESMLDELKSTRGQLHNLAIENRAISERLSHQQQNIDKWDGRIWGLVTLMVGALLSLAAGLIVALSRKTP